MPQVSVATSSTAANLRAVPPRFTCTWKAGDAGAAWIHVTGELDLSTAPLLERALRDSHSYARVVVLDLRELTFIESTGVHLILDAAASARRGHGRLILVRGPTHIDRALHLTDATSQVLIVDLDPAEPPALTLPRSAQTSAAT